MPKTDSVTPADIMESILHLMIDCALEAREHEEGGLDHDTIEDLEALAEAAEQFEQEVAGMKGGTKVLLELVTKGEWREGDHHRGQPGNAGQFSSGGGSSRPSGNTRPASGRDTSTPSRGTGLRRTAERALAKIGAYSMAALKRTFKWGGDLEHAAKEAIAKIEPALDEIETNSTRRLLKGLWIITKFGTKTAFATYTAGQQLAADVAEEKKLSEEATAKLTGIATACDLGGAKAIPLTLGAVGFGADTALGGSFVPIGSLSYITYALATDYKATGRGVKRSLGRITKTIGRAKDKVAAWFGKKTEDKAAKTSKDVREAVELLADRVAEHESDDWDAYLFAALDHADTLEEAIECADECFAEEADGGTETKALLARLIRKEFREEDHPRGQPGNAGQFGPGGGSGSGQPKRKPKRKPKPPEEVAVGRPTKPEERHKGAVPPKKAPRKPPKPKAASKAPIDPETGRARKGYTASGMTNTAFGDMAEALLEELGMRSILPVGKRSHAAGEVAELGSSLDREYDHSGYLFECKAVSIEGTEFKAKPKAAEMEDKRRFAEMHEGTPCTMIVVVDSDNGEAHAYWREGIGAFSLTETNYELWNYAGTVRFTLPGKEE